MRTGIVFDERCSRHCLPHGMSHVERPARSTAIWDNLVKSGLADRCIRMNAREATLDELRNCHNESHIKLILDWHNLDSEDLPFRMIDSDTYTCPGSATAALLAVGGLVDLCECVVSGSLSNGISILRPPGHHAGLNGPSGFCLFNNVAVAAKTVQKRHPHIKKVLIFDWDVHHGNGTEDIFYEDSTVLFQSIHRGNGFYPCSGYADDVGEDEGEGFNINVPLPNGDTGDDAYMHVMKEIFLPIASEFAPDLIIVSAGFDAALGDPLGGMAVSPDGFARMTAALSEIQPRIVLALEGGYNLEAISLCAARCVQSLLDGQNSLEYPELDEPLDCYDLLEVISEVKRVHSPFWSCFQILGDEIDCIDAQARSLLDRIRTITSGVYSDAALVPVNRPDGESPDSDSQCLELDSCSDEFLLETQTA